MKTLCKSTPVQDLVEYALAAGMIFVTAVAAMPALSAMASNLFSHIGSLVMANAH